MGLHIAVIHYSATGNVHALASAIADGAREEGAEVRLRRVAELAPEEAIAANPRWVAHRAATADLPEATVDDLEWADGFALGSPTRFGLPAAQLKQFLDQTGGLWARNGLVDKVGTAFTSASTGHGGLEATVLAINTVLYHWGSIVLPLGYTDAVDQVDGESVRFQLGVGQGVGARRSGVGRGSSPGASSRSGRRRRAGAALIAPSSVLNCGSGRRRTTPGCGFRNRAARTPRVRRDCRSPGGGTGSLRWPRSHQRRAR